MSDWLSDDSDNLYATLDDPAMPDTALAPPTAPAARDAGGGDWMSDTSSDWLGESAQPATPQPGYQANTGAPVGDSQGSWMSGGTATQAPPQAQAAPATGFAQPIAQSLGGDLQVAPPQLESVQRSQARGTGSRGELSNLVLDVEVQVEVGLGNAALTVEEFLEMGRGSIVELDTPIDAPIELRVRGKLIARGQLVSVGGSYGMRIVEMLNEN
ncbi:MAG: FliM/FliN family flagellar motor switch protein [Thermoleophilia bacterium]|nr:FliM/FliN family flagellar motor switch protein [Thermoleophilia bacterium]